MSSTLIEVDRARCTGIGICESVLPERFEVDDDGGLTVHDETVAAEDRDDVEEAVRSCPAAALRLTTGEAR